MEQHIHHIIPKHLGGNNDPDNLVEVTVEEHAKIHHSLWILGGRWQDEVAWRGLTRQINGEQARIEALRHAKKSKPVSAESREKMRLAKLGRKQTPEHVAKRFKWRQGYKHSDETKQKIGLSNKISQIGNTNGFQKGNRWRVIRSERNGTA